MTKVISKYSRMLGKRTRGEGYTTFNNSRRKFRKFQKSSGKSFKQSYRSNQGAKALKMVRRLQKQIETQEATYELAARQHVSSISQGLYIPTTTGAPEGNEVSLKSLKMNILTTSDTVETRGFIQRTVLVYDRRHDSAHASGSWIIPSWNEVFNGTTINAVLNRTIPFRGRFDILYDNINEIDTSSSTTVQKIYIDLKNKKVKSSGSFDVGETAQGNIYFMTMTYGNTQNVAIQAVSRVMYKDE